MNQKYNTYIKTNEHKQIRLKKLLRICLIFFIHNK